VIAVDVAQCEVGTFATSPIITGAAAITRAAETGTMPFVVPSEFSLLAELVTTERVSGTGAATNQLVAADDGTTNNVFELQQRTTATPTSRLTVVIGGTGTALATSVLTLGAVHKHIGAYSGGNVAYCANGGAVATQSGLTLPALNRIRFAAFGSGGANSITYLRRIVVYPTSLSSSVLQALTA
jgi:hypothetical protein